MFPDLEPFSRPFFYAGVRGSQTSTTFFFRRGKCVIMGLLMNINARNLWDFISERPMNRGKKRRLR